MTCQLEIEVVGEKSLKLKTDEGSFGNNCTMLFLDGEEVLVGIAMREDHSLTT